MHAHVIAHEISGMPGQKCSIVAVDRLSGSKGLTWSSEDGSTCFLPTLTGENIRVQDVDVIWWRRSQTPNLDSTNGVPTEVTDEAARDLIVHDCRATLRGALLVEFRGQWVSHPESTRAAGNKLVQLAAARRAGFRIPQTLVSQDPSAIRRFVGHHEGDAVVKVVQGTKHTPLL